MRHELNAGWTLRCARPAPGAPALPDVAATVPGCVHTDLLAAGLIPDPFAADNEAGLGWVGESDWVYETTFDVAETLADDEHLELVCDGLDTFATLSVNDVEVGRSENMHRSYRFDVACAARKGTNVLRVAFRSAVVEALTRQEEHGAWPNVLPGRPFNQVRKMACSWGWDWGPWLTTAGIWRTIALERWHGARLAMVRPVVRLDGADGDVEIDVRVDGGDAVAVRARLTGPDGRDAAQSTTAAGDANVDANVTVRLRVKDAERWWPHTRGGQPLYRLDVDLLDEARGVIDTWFRRIGFRSIELDAREDDIGRRFEFVVGGTRHVAKGVNWIPDDVFVTRVTAARYRAALHDAVEAGVDLVRIWGGGIYEDDAFYDACDELGLMVWQDFTFSCAAYPEAELDAEVQAEAQDNILRLMPHPSLVLWNGNNENIWGWHEWGWQHALDGRAWGATWYFETLPRIVAELDPTRPYWPGSPYSGSPDAPPNDDDHGCSHLWDVWNERDYEHYRSRVPRFAAEFGWQAPAAWSTLRAALGADSLAVDSPILARHQKADRGAQKLERGLTAHLGAPRSFDAWLWATQLLQARALSTGIEHLRSRPDRCAGTIWWQLNDCWPVISWSVVDSAGQRKPAWYALRAAYAPRLATIQPRGDSLVLTLVNDTDQSWSASGSVRRMAVDGSQLHEHLVAVDVPVHATHVVTLDNGTATASDPRREFLVADITGTRRASWWFAPDRELDLPHRRLTASVSQIGDNDVAVDVHSSSLLLDVALFPDRLVPGAQVDDQLVTMLPGEDHRFVISFPAGTLSTTDLEPARLAATPVLWTVNSLLAPR